MQRASGPPPTPSSAPLDHPCWLGERTVHGGRGSEPERDEQLAERPPLALLLGKCRRELLLRQQAELAMS